MRKILPRAQPSASGDRKTRHGNLSREMTDQRHPKIGRRFYSILEAKDGSLCFCLGRKFELWRKWPCYRTNWRKAVPCRCYRGFSRRWWAFSRFRKRSFPTTPPSAGANKKTTHGRLNRKFRHCWNPKIWRKFYSILRAGDWSLNFYLNRNFEPCWKWPCDRQNRRRAEPCRPDGASPISQREFSGCRRSNLPARSRWA